MPASTDPRGFGQVWAWLGTPWLIVAPDPSRSDPQIGLEAWLCVYLGKDCASLAAARVREGRSLLDSMVWAGNMEDRWERLA